MPWFLTPHGPHFVVEPGTIDEYERRDYTPLTSQQVTDYYAGVAIPEPSFATEAEVPGIIAGAVAAGTGPVAAALRAAFRTLTLGQFELQAMRVDGHSWQAADTNATPGARWYERLARRLGIAGTPTNKAQSGRTIGDIATAALSGPLGWVARTRALVGVICTINDLTLFDGSAASRRGFKHAWRALLAQYTANGVVAANTTSFAYSAGWTIETPAVSTAQAANVNTTGGARWTTSTVGSAFDFTVTGTAVDVVLIARAAGAGLCTFTVGGTTVGTLDLALPTAQDCPAIAPLRGLGTGTHTVRGTLTSGASLTVDSIRIPSTAPVPGIVLGEPPVIPTGTDHATYLADLETFKADLAAIVADFPSFVYVDLDQPGWDPATMLTDDGKHPNDAGAAWIADRALLGVAQLPYSPGLNVLSAAATPTAYVPPAGPSIPAGGSAGTGPVLPVADDFNRANGALAGSTTSTGGKVWAAIGTAVANIVSNAVKVASGTGNSYYTVDANAPDGDVQATLTAVSGSVTTMISGLAMRVIDANNQLTVQLRSNSTTGNDKYALTSRIGGTSTVLVASTLIPTATDVVKAEMRGNTVRVLVDGVEIIPFTAVDPIFAASTKHGLYFNGSDTVSTWDAWSFTPVA